MAIEIERVPIHLKAALTIKETLNTAILKSIKLTVCRGNQTVPLSFTLAQRDWESVKSLRFFSVKNW